MDGQTKEQKVLREIVTHSADETISLGRTLADFLAPPTLVLLRGDLGAGKTTLVKGIAAAFEAAAEEEKRNYKKGSHKHSSKRNAQQPSAGSITGAED